MPEPFPWQRRLHEQWFANGKVPKACTLPTGLGKTSVISIWLIALANHGGKLANGGSYTAVVNVQLNSSNRETTASCAFNLSPVIKIKSSH